MRYFAVIDTNVLISALIKWESIPGSIIELVFKGGIVPVVNRSILQEYQKVLIRDKFRFSIDEVENTLFEIERFAKFVDAEQLDIVLPDPKDKVFYEVLMEERKREDAYLITGNMKHFPTASYIVTPRQMSDIVCSDLGLV